MKSPNSSKIIRDSSKKIHRVNNAFRRANKVVHRDYTTRLVLQNRVGVFLQIVGVILQIVVGIDLQGVGVD